MGMLDGIIGGLMNQGGGGNRSLLVTAALELLQRNGGIEGLLQRFEAAGQGQQMQSWISSGPNAPIDPAALTRILGSGQLGQIATQLGLTHDQIAGGLSQALPQVVDSMTPQGTIPDNHDDLVSQALSILRSKGTS